ncbi:7 transmembrane receptor [Dictyocaulus viviparus]|uniref:7 transmembrane receptor n=1 Tax=Dictyocaulus viviparus TaxID=29172 RepID=A0A0D8XYB3_DICVI|nr:7 transmembrane receptor [Dictyocaulus viviparus]
MLSYALISNILILVGIARSSTMRTATRNILMIFFYDLFWYTGVVQLGLMAGNRFVSIVYPMEYKNLFSRKRSIYLISLGYLLGFLVSLPTLFPCCHTLWNSDYYITVYQPMDTWYVTSPNTHNLPYSFHRFLRYKYVDMSVNSISLFMMIMSYAVIIYKVRESGRAMAKYQLTIRTRQQRAMISGMSISCQMNEMNGCTRLPSVRPPRSQVSKKEMRLFIQFFVVSLVFLLTWTTWQWLPHMSGSKWAYFLMTSLFFINNSVNPTVYLLFNTQLRKELHYLLCRHHDISSVQNKGRQSLSGKDVGKPTIVKSRSTTVGEEIHSHDLAPSISSHCNPPDEQKKSQLIIIQDASYIDKKKIRSV